MSAKDPGTLDRMLIGLKLKKAQGALTREQAMQAWPVRNPALKTHVNDDGLVTIELPRRKDAVGGMLGFLFQVPESKPVQLDEIGSFVHERCDGEHTVNDIVDEMMHEYKLNRREVEVSLTQFLQDLAKRGIIAFAVPREIAEEAGLAGESYALEAEPAPEADADAAAGPDADAVEAETAPEDTDAITPAGDADDQEHPGRV